MKKLDHEEPIENNGKTLRNWLLDIPRKTYQVDYYNLDVIISVGYRVKSTRGTQFCIWATGILKEYMKKGFAMDDERLKGNGGLIVLEIITQPCLLDQISSLFVMVYTGSRQHEQFEVHENVKALMTELNAEFHLLEEYNYDHT